MPSANKASEGTRGNPARSQRSKTRPASAAVSENTTPRDKRSVSQALAIPPKCYARQSGSGDSRSRCAEQVAPRADIDRIWLPSVSREARSRLFECAPALAAVKQRALDRGCGPEPTRGGGSGPKNGSGD
jgi:hypothetical protein